VTGNDAAALGAVYAARPVCAWYPITPSSSLAEAFQAHCARLPARSRYKKRRYGDHPGGRRARLDRPGDRPGWNGARAFTATSGPGISLMQEFIGLAYFAEIPAVIFDIQRGSRRPACRPARSRPTSSPPPMPAWRYQARPAVPEGPERGLHLRADALDLRDRLQTPIFVMLDLDIGMNEWLVEPLRWDPARRYDAARS